MTIYSKCICYYTLKKLSTMKNTGKNLHMEKYFNMKWIVNTLKKIYSLVDAFMVMCLNHRTEVMLILQPLYCPVSSKWKPKIQGQQCTKTAYLSVLFSFFLWEVTCFALSNIAWQSLYLCGRHKQNAMKNWFGIRVP